MSHLDAREVFPTLETSTEPLVSKVLLELQFVEAAVDHWLDVTKPFIGRRQPLLFYVCSQGLRPRRHSVQCMKLDVTLQVPAFECAERKTFIMLHDNAGAATSATMLPSILQWSKNWLVKPCSVLVGACLKTDHGSGTPQQLILLTTRIATPCYRRLAIYDSLVSLTWQQR